MTPRMYKRQTKLAKPKLQARLVLTLIGPAVLGLLLQQLLLGTLLYREVREIPEAGAQLYGQLPGIMGVVLALSVAIIVPVLFSVGVIATFPIAGPILKFERYLGEVARGEAVGPCRIRKSDQLHELCELINQALEARSAATPAPAPGDGEAEDLAA